MKNYFILLIVLSVFLVCCTFKEKPKNNIKDSEKYQLIEKSQWLTGCWQHRSAKGILTETWRQLDDSTMIGQSYFIAVSDTLSLENIRLEQRNGTLAYVPVVRDQNNGQAVYFTLTHLADNTMVFENPQHDFPQKISYSLKANDSLIAIVSAVENGKERSQTFRMGKIAD